MKLEEKPTGTDVEIIAQVKGKAGKIIITAQTMKLKAMKWLKVWAKNANYG